MKSGIHEERSRIVLYLPFNNPGEAKAVAGVLSYLKSKRVGFGQGRIKGFTQTRAFPTSYEGWWWSARRRKWVRDDLALIVVDHEFRLSDPKLQYEIDDLKQSASKLYASQNRPQEEIWLVVHSVWRYD
jgi:hypothetical protein